MKLSDMALQEHNPGTVLSSILFVLGVRYVLMKNDYHSELFAVLGVPPWRELTVKDIYEKKAISLAP